MNSNRITPVNNVTIPLAVEHHIHAIRIEQIQGDCQRILDRDATFFQSARQLRSQKTAGVVPEHTFKSVTQWRVNSALRRAGLPLNVARCYAHLNPQCA